MFMLKNNKVAWHVPTKDEWHRAYLVLLNMSRGASLSRAAKLQGLSPEQVWSYVGEHLEKQAGRWAIAPGFRGEWPSWTDHAVAAMNVITIDGMKQVFISDPQRQLEYVRYWQCIQEAMRGYLFECATPEPEPFNQSEQEAMCSGAFEALLRLHTFRGRTFSDDDGIEYWYITDIDLLREIFDAYRPAWLDLDPPDPADEINEPDWG